MITFNPQPADGVNMFITYDVSIYASGEITYFLQDAAVNVVSDLGLPWYVDRNANLIVQPSGVTDPFDSMYDPNGVFDEDVEKLIVFRTAIQMYEDKSSGAADDAIKIRDGDTSIDTSTTANSSQTFLKRLDQQYSEALLRVRLRRFRGAVTDLRDMSITERLWPKNYPNRFPHPEQ